MSLDSGHQESPPQLPPVIQPGGLTWAWWDLPASHQLPCPSCHPGPTVSQGPWRASSWGPRSGSPRPHCSRDGDGCRGITVVQPPPSLWAADLHLSCCSLSSCPLAVPLAEDGPDSVQESCARGGAGDVHLLVFTPSRSGCLRMV